MKKKRKLLAVLNVLILIWGTSLSSAQFLDTAFRNSSPNDTAIIERVYGGDGAYTNGRNSNICNTGAMSVVHINAGSDFQNLAINNNTIYVLEPGIHTLTAGKYIYGQCIALVAKPNTIVHTSTQASEIINIWGSATNIVLDGFTIDGDDDGIGGTHAYDSYGLKFVTSAWSVSNNSFNNLTIQNTEYAVDIFGQSATNTAEYNIFTNNTFLNNSYGVNIVNSTTDPSATSNNTLSWNTFTDNGTGVQDSGSNTTIDSNTYSWNDTAGDTGTNPSGNDITPTITEPNSCTDPDGCNCYGTIISNGDQCTDGNRSTINNGDTCNDPNGCICGTSNINDGASCTINSSGGGSSGGGWGWGGSVRDDCPNGDFSNSYYDGICGTNPNTPEYTTGSVLDNDSYDSYSAINKASLLAQAYTTRTEAGETTLRHGLFFSIIANYATLQNRSDTKVKAVLWVLINIFSQMNENILTKYHFSKVRLLEELERARS